MERNLKMNSSTIAGLSQGTISFPQFSFERLRERRHVSKNRVLDMGVEILDFKTDERQYIVSYWNNDRKPDHIRRLFKDKAKANRLFDRANLILIDTYDLRESRRIHHEAYLKKRRQENDS